MTEISSNIKILNVTKKYGENVIIPNLSLDIKDGEFFTLLGPSGCGKTTLLRMIAGFNTIENGTISFDDEVVNNVPAHNRNIGMVFQNYAIFPHLTVEENVKYGLKLRKLPKDEINKRLDHILNVVKIEEYRSRIPERLSGGQQQRVALARAIVVYPNVLLMDEPLSNLDAKLRVEMRGAIKEIQKEIGITTIYVTHDQEEALAISDRIAIMNHGIIQQIGTPQEIYNRPFNTFVAGFIGQTNLIKAKLKVEDNKSTIVFNNDYSIEMKNLSDEVEDNQEVLVGVRPENLTISDSGFKAIVKKSTFLGRYVNYDLFFEDLDTEQVHLEFSQDIDTVDTILNVGDSLYLKVNALKINVFTIDGNLNLIEGVYQYV